MQDDVNNASAEWFALSDGMHPLVPRPENADLIAVRGLMPLPVTESPAFRAVEEVVTAALLIVSQSDKARGLAQLAIDKGYSLNITGTNTESASAVASANTNPVLKKINLGAADDAEALALRIIHELVHVSQIERGGLSLDVRDSTPENSIRQLLAMEADARARAVEIAAELEFLKKDDPAERLVFPGITLKAGIEAGVAQTAEIVRHAPLHDMDAVKDAVFKSFYTSAGLRQHYETTVLNTLQSAGETKSTGGKTAQELKEALGGYITADLDAPFYTAVSQRTASALQLPLPVYQTKSGPAP